MLSGEQWNQLLLGFLSEGRDLLKEAEDSLLRLEASPADQDAVNQLFRAVHTLKGSAGIFSLTPLVNLTHHLESLLMSVRDGQRELTPALTSLMLNCMDELSAMIERVDPDSGLLDADEARQAPLLAALFEAQGHIAEPAPGPETDTPSAAEAALVNWQVSIRFSEELFRNGFDPAAFLRYLKRLGEITQLETVSKALPALEQLNPETCHLGFEFSLRSAASQGEIEDVFEFIQDFCTLRLVPEDHLPVPAAEALLAAQATLNPAPERTPVSRDRRPLETSLVKVAAHKLDELINLVGELVISTAGAQMQARRNGDSGCLESIQAVHQHVEQIRETALKLRMVEVGETFNRFHRVVRDVSQELGKQIQLSLRGGETELDKSVIDKIADPLTHLVRNAIDHGIESAAERLAVGKPAEGNLSLNAYHDSGMIVLEVQDDGRGLNTARILEKAIDKGLVDPDAQLADADIHGLIFEAGFSTAEQVSNLSGRGVGMDVVRSAAERFGGGADVTSRPGEGTSVRLSLPLSMAITRVMVVEASGTMFGIPMDTIAETVRLQAGRIRRVGQAEAFVLRDTVVPLIRLADLLRMETAGGAGNGAEGDAVLVVRVGGATAGLVVDRFREGTDVVLKPLEGMLAGMRGYAGTALLGDGRVLMVLNLKELLQ